jgi:hypothetical protein
VARDAAVTVSFRIERAITFNSIALTTTLVPLGTRIGVSFKGFSVAAPISDATHTIAGGNHGQQYTSPQGITSPISGAFDVGADSKVEGWWFPGETDAYTSTDAILVSGLVTTIDTSQGAYKSQISIAARRKVFAAATERAAVYAHAARPHGIITSATITTLR